MTLVLLYLSAAFDTVHYDILVGQLAKRSGIRVVVLQWLNSYLCSRTRTVTIMDATSVLAEVLFGVPERESISFSVILMFADVICCF